MSFDWDCKGRVKIQIILNVDEYRAWNLPTVCLSLSSQSKPNQSILPNLLWYQCQLDHSQIILVETIQGCGGSVSVLHCLPSKCFVLEQMFITLWACQRNLHSICQNHLFWMSITWRVANRLFLHQFWQRPLYNSYCSEASAQQGFKPQNKEAHRIVSYSSFLSFELP